MRQRTWKRILVYGILTVLAITFLIPLYGAVVISFKSNREVLFRNVWLPPQGFTVAPYRSAWREGRLGKAFTNSILITIPSVFGSIFIASLGAYAVSRIRFKGNLLVYIFFVSGLFFPPHSFIVSLYKLFDSLGLYDTLWALIITNIAFGIPVCTMVLTNYFKDIPYEIQEAATIDGASAWQVYQIIILPLSKPALAVIAIFQFTWIWNNFIWGLILSENRAIPVMLGLLNLKGQYFISWNVQAAGSVVAILPVLAVFIAFQRYFIKGLVAGYGK